ncbi:protein GIGAS CELL1 [Dioscorea cayenensis subsp. rotundata]|uniref:Protein GIGAS CELL1 n=1 Tax=Dioscorea cayennensis subsp. rotundata TaxID=55577 RepID=A0AB40BT67_DIOCR|nr:protein GIGAS CELL1 [Dioscorea cayenensis subsp. rotundata]
MPELKEWMVRVGKVEDGVWMRRGASPRSPMVIAVDNKENLPPWRSARRRRSPLPAWYPRTPLRDITVIVRALERSRARMEAAAAERRRLGIGTESSPRLLLSPSPLPPVSSPSGQTPSTPHPASNISDSTATTNTTVLVTTTPPPADQSLETLSPPLSVKPSAKTLNPIEAEEKLCRSIDVIEKSVLKNLKKTKEQNTRRTTTARRNILLSMR